MTTLELCDRADVTEGARKIATKDMHVRNYVQQLARGGMAPDAIGALAQLLPNRACISWGLNCIRQVKAATAMRNAEAVLHAVEQWLKEPGDDLRRAAYRAGEHADLRTPAGGLGLAVFLSGGNMGPAEAPMAPVEPAPKLCGKTVTVCLAAAVALDPRNAAELRSAFLDQGLHLAEQLKIWEPEK